MIPSERTLRLVGQLVGPKQEQEIRDYIAAREDPRAFNDPLPAKEMVATLTVSSKRCPTIEAIAKREDA